MRIWAVRTAVVLAAAVLWTLPLELLSRWWIGRYGDPLDRSLAVLRLDGTLGWRQKERFRGRSMGVRVETDSRGLRNPPGRALRPGGKRVLILGPSSTFGWGVPEADSYPRRLERLLNAAGADGAVRVINAGQIGFSSWQGLELYRRELRELKPDLVIAAYGANDVDRFRFFFAGPLPDAEALGPGLRPPLLGLRNALGGLRMLRLAGRQAARLRRRLACRLGRTADPAAGVWSERVPGPDFTRNMRELARSAQAGGARMLLLNTAFHYPRAAPVSPAGLERSRSSLAAGLERLSARDFPAAERALRASLSVDPSAVEARYALSAGYAAERRCAESRAAFRDAREREPFRVGRDLLALNRRLWELARERKLPLVDAAALLGNADPGMMFTDPIHPSSEGHRRIAEALFAEIERLRLLR